jgi:small-conductance mechanosensitive channel
MTFASSRPARRLPALALWFLLAALTLLAPRFALAEPAAPATSAPAASASSAPKVVGASARIRDQQVFTVKVARNGHSAAERAAHATEVMEHAVEEPVAPPVRVEDGGDVVIVYVGDAPVIQLGPEDALADGDASAAVHAAVIAARVTEAIHAERRRSALATTVFSASLLVFSALMVFLALSKLGGLVSHGRDWVVSRPSSLPNVRIAGIDVVRPTALRGVALGAIDGSTWLLRLGLVYGWILFALSLFDVTRAYSARLTGFVIAPLYGLVGRLAGAMPVLVIGAVAGVVLLLSLRVVGLFFEGVARGEPSLSWLPSDLAAPTSVLVRIGLVVAAASIATPLITGNEEGPLARASLVAMGAIALSLIPVMASAAVGVTVLFGRKLKVGEFVEVGGRAGVVRSTMLLSVCLEDAQGCQVRIPHLASLLHPTRVLGAMPPIIVEVCVSPAADVAAVIAILSRVAEGVGIRGRVELTHLDADAAVYLVTVLSASANARSDILSATSTELRAAGIGLGRSATYASPA